MAAVDQSSSSSRRYFDWYPLEETAIDTEPAVALLPSDFHHSFDALSVSEDGDDTLALRPLMRRPTPKKKVRKVLKSVINSVISCNRHPSSLDHPTLGSRVIGTLFGYRKGHVHFAFQSDPGSIPALLVELATPTCCLVKEMASGLVRIALECERERSGCGGQKGRSRGRPLLQEPVWRTYCNGRKSGYAVARECTMGDMRVLRSVQAITMGAGVLPGSGPEGELMYMRARFERVVGSRDSEAFYMINPDGTGGPELSIFLLRV
ncbi:protein MIZU-KUSSEI 1-like [Nymphaea colorata]|uniref:Protein MIZU-KUSSEI 1 n=1 Tax=Nymphaea colorata TaxID=210225 RepID=A0A5K1FY52_9MAGN|nr:protein MIZU-KUSSEI 1-like [Nymphaea colorata]